MGNGYIEAQGEYQDLVADNAEFARLMQQFGGEEKREEEEEEEEEAINGISGQQAIIDEEKIKSNSKERTGAGTGKLEGRLMVAEKRSTGSVSWGVYGAYMEAGRAYFTVPFIVCFMVLMQGSQIVNSYTLVWWQAKYVPCSLPRISLTSLSVLSIVQTRFIKSCMLVLVLDSRYLH